MRISVILASIMAVAASPASAQAGQGEVEVVALVAPVGAGEIIGELDLEPILVSATAARNALDFEELVGKEARRRLDAGKPLKRYDVIEPQLVRKGDQVSLLVARGPMTISATGKAMGNAAKGDTVRVQNTSSYAVVEGRAIEPGVVQVLSSRR